MRGFDMGVVAVAVVVIAVTQSILPYRPIVCTAAPDPARSGFSFGSGGLLVAYHIGVVEGLRETYGNDLQFVPLAGASCGVIAALCVRMNLSIDEMKESFWELLDHVRRYGPQASVTLLRDQLERMLPPNAHELCNRGDFHVELSSSANFRPFFVSRFESRDDLIDVVCASCSIPFVTHNAVTPWVFDGIFLNRCDPRVASMSPVDCFSFPWQTAPQPGEIRHFPMTIRDYGSGALVPDTNERYEHLFSLGKEQANHANHYPR